MGFFDSFYKSKQAKEYYKNAKLLELGTVIGEAKANFDKMENEIDKLQYENKRLREALEIVGNDILKNNDGKTITDTLWHSDVETIIEYICNTLGSEALTKEEE